MDKVVPLANAIVAQAAEDYRDALRGRGVPYRSPNTVLQEVTEFFHSDWYALLTSVDPDRLLNMLYAEFKAGEELLAAGEKAYEGTPFGEWVKFVCPHCGKRRAKFRVHQMIMKGGARVFRKKVHCTKCHTDEFRYITGEEANGFKD